MKLTNSLCIVVIGCQTRWISSFLMCTTRKRSSSTNDALWGCLWTELYFFTSYPSAVLFSFLFIFDFKSALKVLLSSFLPAGVLSIMQHDWYPNLKLVIFIIRSLKSLLFWEPVRLLMLLHKLWNFSSRCLAPCDILPYIRPCFFHAQITNFFNLFYQTLMRKPSQFEDQVEAYLMDTSNSRP
jgi:hypothetical protein